ncbi:hypothetical protein EMIT0180MI3_380005 [Priestia megaterium]
MDALFHEDRGRCPPPVRGTLPLNPIQKTPPTPSLFEGAPSPVGVKQTHLFECQEGLGVESLSIP